VIRAARTALRPVSSLIREKWFDFWIAQSNPMSPYLHELLIARANLTRPMQPRRTR
jgi:hypothetical protein